MTAKETYTFDQFLAEVNPEHLPFVMGIHEALLRKGYSTKVELAKNGFVVSYLQPKTKKTLLNYVFRKGGMQARVYGDHFAQYLPVVQTLPPTMVKQIAKQPDCKRLLNPTSCNSRCTMGFAFTIDETLYQKCRYGCFLFPVTSESIPYLQSLIESEAAAREAA